MRSGSNSKSTTIPKRDRFVKADRIGQRGIDSAGVLDRQLPEQDAGIGETLAVAVEMVGPTQKRIDIERGRLVDGV